VTYHPRHLKQSPRPRRPWSRQLLIPIFAALLILFGATPALADDHVAVRGNTLWGIAARYCGTGTKFMDLARGNGIKNPDLIYVGQTIHLTCGTRPAPTTVSRSNPARSTPPSGWVQPVPGAKTTDCFGSRGGRHLGTDLAAPAGTPIHAVHAGTVAVVKYEAGGGGNYIVINHGGGIFSAYMHMNARSPLNVGASVQTGQTIGFVGRTGDATGNHAHFEIHQGLWHKISPAAFMRAHGVSVGC